MLRFVLSRYELGITGPRSSWLWGNWLTFVPKSGMFSRKEKKVWYMWERIWYICFSWKKLKYDTYERVVCFLGRRLIFASKRLVFWWLQQTATDCNRLQRTATERRLIFASKSLVFRWLQQTATDCNRLQQTATERTLHFLRRPSHFPVSDISICISIHPCIYVCICLCIYARTCVLMYSRVYASTCVSMYLCIYLCIYLYIHIYYLVDTLTSYRAASAMMQWAGSIHLTK